MPLLSFLVPRVVHYALHGLPLALGLLALARARPGRRRHRWIAQCQLRGRALPESDDGIKDSRRPFFLSSLVDPSLVQPMSGPLHQIVGADVDRNELLVFNQQLKRDAIDQVDGDRMQSLQAAPQRMQTQRRMVWVGFQQEQGFPVGLSHVGMAPNKTSGSAVVPLGEHQRPTQG
jgi:hypothetical protein